MRAISHLPQSIGSLKGREAFNVRDLHRQYGEVVRVAPDLLSFATATAWSDIHGHGKGFTKYGYFEVSDKAQPLLTANDKDYTRQRATLAHGFSERAIIGQETALRKNIDQLLQKLGEKATKHEAVNIGMWMDFLTFDIIGEFTLNTQFGCVKNSQNHPWVSLMIKFMHAVGKAIHATAFGIFAPFILLSINRKDLMGMKTHLKLSSEKVRERIEMGEQEDKADLWTYVLRNKGDQSMSLPEMEVNAAFLLSASTAPMSDVICGALYLLAKHPEALATLRRELESTFTSDKEITISATAKLPYLRGILDETMRYYTPFPGGARRQAPPGGAYVSGYFVPGKVR